MASVSEPKPAFRRRSPVAWFEIWNRKLHYYLGLYFLFFLWLFSVSGLLLNHGGWKFAEFWPNRTERSFEREIQVPPPGSDPWRARDLMRQLGLTGEIEWPSGPRAPNTFVFDVNCPGKMNRVTVDVLRRRAAVKQTGINAWGVLRVLHTFSGVRMNSPERTRDWIMTRVWVVSMDALAGGLLIMVLGSYYLWYRMKAKRSLGLLALAAGSLVCAWFVFGLSRLPG